MRWTVSTSPLFVLAWGGLAAFAAEPPPERPAPPIEVWLEEVEPSEEVEVRARRESAFLPDSRAVEHIDRKTLEERQPRSTPDALRFTPGVYVQQTGHGQASPYIRGRTGQHTLLLFDGLRLNHALFRQGPNQYLFTVDARTLERIEVVRGAASVVLGADAMSGAVLLTPQEPGVDPTRDGLRVTPKVALRHATADREIGGRAQADVQVGARTGVLFGVGARRAGQLESAGPVAHLTPAEKVTVPLFEKDVPSFEADNRTQRGTGFRELTADGRLVHDLTPRDRLTLAAYAFRQYDAPRTDQCPPPEASLAECLVFDEQFRTQIYGKADLRPGLRGLNETTVVFGHQRQHERRTNDRTASVRAITGGRDAISMWDGRATARTRALALGESLRLRVSYGADATHEQVESASWITLTGNNITRRRSRGQYLDGSRYLQGGVWTTTALDYREVLTLRVGGRGAAVLAEVPDDPESQSRGLSQTWWAAVGHAGLEWRPHAAWSLLVNVEQGFRPPNLDDLSARQPTGRGYQLENPDLRPERATTLEAGARFKRRWGALSAWVFRQSIDDLIERRPATCPPSDRECRAARIAVDLVNLPDAATIVGAEVVGELRLGDVSARATVAWAHGEGPSPVAGDTSRVPLSRIPPLNGAAELTWRDPDNGLYAGAALRWARDQTRLSIGDVGDARVPFGGTPGYAVADLRAGLRVPDAGSLALVLENVNDAPYRIHGSAINGPGRGLIVQLELML